MAKSLVCDAKFVAILGHGESTLFGRLGIPRNRVVVVPNGFERPSEILPLRGLASVINRPYVLFLGYLDPRKQPMFLAEVFARSRLPRSHQLIFAGPDSYGHRAAVEKAVKSLGLSDVARVVGPIYGPEKWSLLANASCLCLPSLAEGQPLVMCEALGAGLPTIYSSACNFPEVAQMGAGIEMSGFRVIDWCEALERVCLSPETQASMRDMARQNAEQYTWHNIAKTWAALYDKAAFNLQTMQG